MCIRDSFEIDTNSIVLAALSALEQDGAMPAGTVDDAAAKLGVERERYDKTD